MRKYIATIEADAETSETFRACYDPETNMITTGSGNELWWMGCDAPSDQQLVKTVYGLFGCWPWQIIDCIEA